MMRMGMILLLCSFLGLAACVKAPPGPCLPQQSCMGVAESSTAGSLIPRQAMVEASVPDGFLLSPDGRFLAYRERSDQGEALWIRHLDRQDKIKVSAGSDRSLRALTWSMDGRRLFYIDRRKNRRQPELRCFDRVSTRDDKIVNIGSG